MDLEVVVVAVLGVLAFAAHDCRELGELAGGRDRARPAQLRAGNQLVNWIADILIPRRGRNLPGEGAASPSYDFQCVYSISSARAESCASFSGVIAPRMVTVEANSRPFDFSKRPFITFAAAGAQLPFSMKPTLRFW